MRNIALVKIGLIAGLLTAMGGGQALAEIDIYVDRAAQEMTVIVDGAERYRWKVSTGKAGYSTPKGFFHPNRMEPDHFSREWDDAPMPHSIFFTHRGHAIHGSTHTSRLGNPASRGCVRLSPENAATLYSLVEREGMAATRIAVYGSDNDAGYVAPPRGKRVDASRGKPGGFLLRNRWR